MLVTMINLVKFVGWYHGLPSTLDRCQGVNEEDEVFHVRVQAQLSGCVR